MFKSNSDQPGHLVGSNVEAYILIEAQDALGPEVAEDFVDLSTRHTETKGKGIVEVAAAVWGAWDVVVRVSSCDLKSLNEFLVDSTKYIDGIRSTETLIVRDKLEIDADPGTPEGTARGDFLAFICLKIHSQYLPSIHDGAEMMRDELDSIQANHIAITYGRFDIIAEVRFSELKDLKECLTLVQYATPVRKSQDTGWHADRLAERTETLIRFV